MRGQSSTVRRQIGRRLAIFGVAPLALIGFGVVQNNISVRSVAREQFTSQLDQAVERGTAWVAGHSDDMLEDRNSALFHMLADMDARKPDVRLRRVTERFMNVTGDSLWRRLVDPTVSSSLADLKRLDQLQDYQRWFLFAMAPHHVPLSDEDRRQMFAPDTHHWGSLTHQLFAVYLYRHFRGSSPETDTLMSHLCERVAFEAFWDMRVTDLYLQRTAFLLAAARPDLVKRRWVERVLACQRDDGGWASSWHGWGPGIARVTWATQASNAHTTVQGLWIAHMLRYRYPEWIDQQVDRP